MAQFARPDADTSIGTWTDTGGATSDLFAEIDETVASDADYVKSVTAPANAPLVVALSNVEDPLSSSGHTVRYRYQKNASGGAQIDLTVQLRQGYTNEGSPGTLIAEAVITDIPNGFTNGSFTLTGGEADAITDYTDLFLRFVANQV
jgi:hypothetical protein